MVVMMVGVMMRDCTLALMLIFFDGGVFVGLLV